MGKSNAKLLANIPEIESKKTMLTNHTTMSNYQSITCNSPTIRYQKNIMRLSNAFQGAGQSIMSPIGAPPNITAF